MKTKNYIVAAIASVFVGIINGLLGGGGGMLCVPLLVYSFKLQSKQAHASAILVMLITSVCSSIFYITNLKEKFDIKMLLIVCGVLILGSILGTFLLKKCKNKAIDIVFAVVMLAAGLGMFFR